MAKAGFGTRSRGDGPQVLQADIFFQSKVNLKLILKLDLPSVQKQNAERLLHDLQNFDKWYTVQHLRKLNNPDIKAGRKALTALKASLENAAKTVGALDGEKMFYIRALGVTDFRSFLANVEELKGLLKRVPEQIIRALDQLHGTPGAPSKDYRIEAAERLIAIWHENALGKFSRTFAVAEGQNRRPEFVSPGPRFVHVILRYFEPGIQPGDVKRAILRNRKKVGVNSV